MVPDHGRCRFDTGSLMKLQLLAGQPSRTLKHAAAALYMCCMYLLKLSYGMGAVFGPFLAHRCLLTDLRRLSTHARPSTHRGVR